MDKLSHMIEEAVDKGNLSPMRAGRNGPQVSHLMFADDLILFSEASPNYMRKMQRFLNDFCEESDHLINQAKTNIYFLKNVTEEVRDNIINISGYSETAEIGRYLGAFIHNTGRRNSQFNYIIERVKTKLQGWKANCLSLQG
ncbi:uncharacterized protein [Arachis hypogaea]|uniref:uncharacterized protein n=1 Tax=Arachis hypogaea TaxID=3818 RepID=UPI003B226F42